MNTMNEETALSARLLGALLAFELAKDMVTSGLWMLNNESMMGRIARLSSSSETFAYLWMTLAVLVLPYLILQITGCWQSQRTRITRLACWAILTSGVFWAYMGYLSKNLDYEHITVIFLMHSTACVAMAAILANGLNTAQLKREGG